MQIIDTHAHLFLPEFSNDLNEVVGRANEKGVSRFILPNVDETTIDTLMELSKKFAHFYPLAAIHPCSINKHFEYQIKQVDNWLKTGLFYGVGETGIDLYWSKELINQQKESFRLHLKLAKAYHLPVVVHIRNSFDEVIEIIEQEQNGNLSGILHCFGGNLNQAKKAIDTGFLLGIGGVVTYKNATLKDILPQIDLKNIVVETDAPYLPPVPHRGKRNEPAYLEFVVKKLSEIYQLSYQTIAETTTGNAKKIFNI